MTAQLAKYGDRCFVNEEFLDGVREVYAATTKRMPLGFRTYVGWTGKDEVLFTEHRGVDGLEGPVYEVTWDPANPAAFYDRVLPQVRHTVIDGQQARVAGVAAGLYGYAKGVQAACESTAKKLNRQAALLMREIVSKDEAVVPFLQTHAERTDSTPARVLLGAYKASLPKVASVHEARGKLGLYGYPARTARLALRSCATMREAAGVLAAELHSRRATNHDKITGFLDAHCKSAGCETSRLLLASYPSKDFTFRRARVPTTVDEWLRWREPTG